MIMSAFRLWCLFLFIGTASFVYLGYSSCKGSTDSNPDIVSSGTRNSMTLAVKSRKLKENVATPNPDEGGYVHLEDYRPIDPVPSSKASIRPGPIQHGTPLMPFIPKPSPPPSQPKRGGVP